MLGEIMLREIRVILPGRPYTKKTHNELVFAGRRRWTRGKPRMLPSPEFQAYQARCLAFLMTNYQGPKRLRRVHLAARYYMPNRRSWPDLVGLLQGTCDILQAAGIIEDDRGVVSFDGSRIVGIDKLNPRTEITLTLLGHGMGDIDNCGNGR